ncbi:hypothetical protein IV417_18390 [Alphaproteobacteria bacterium KMM 3653]|uniref:Cation/multidrug efflux pump n=1 Tax=Harenicola maris TaxID=2841044 RepID=A0AAP2CS70_9RHOB|nr:hypothetical protein [Harenicola maris]
MFALLRLSVIGFIVLSIVYIFVSFYSRAKRRGKLEAAWDRGDRDGDWRVDEEDKAGGPFVDRDAYIADGMKKYDGSLRPKLILGVYVVPVFAIGLLIYLTNFA